MAITLNRAGLKYAEERIREGEFDSFDTDWSEIQPTNDEVLHFVDAHDMQEYGLWFLGINNEVPAQLKEHYVYPHGDLKLVQKCALEVTAKEASQKGHKEIADAAEKLLRAIDKQE